MIKNNKPPSNVTVLIEVYNEEKRIESCLRSFSWADEIIVFDKHSTDNTRQLAEKYASEIILVPYCDGSENYVNNFANRNTKEWCLFPTASSLMHPYVAEEIIKLTTHPNFEFDVIGMPYAMHSFGINSRHSPFFMHYKYTLIRKNTLRISTQLHNEISSTSDRVFNIKPRSEQESLYHCTHKNADSFFEHVIRYTRYEAKYDNDLSYKKAVIDIFKAVYTVTFRRKSFLLGKDGIALALAYISYFIIRLIYVWDKRINNEKNDIYEDTRKYIDDLWLEKDRTIDRNS